MLNFGDKIHLKGGRDVTTPFCFTSYPNDSPVTSFVFTRLMLFTMEGPRKQREREREGKREREIERERDRSGVRKEEKIVEETFILPDRNHVLASNQEVKV